MGKAILRFSLMATHTKEQINQVVDILIKSREYVETISIKNFQYE